MEARVDQLVATTSPCDPVFALTLIPKGCFNLTMSGEVGERVRCFEPLSTIQPVRVQRDQRFMKAVTDETLQNM